MPKFRDINKEDVEDAAYSKDEILLVKIGGKWFHVLDNDGHTIRKKDKNILKAAYGNDAVLTYLLSQLPD